MDSQAIVSVTHVQVHGVGCLGGGDVLVVGIDGDVVLVGGRFGISVVGGVVSDGDDLLVLLGDGDGDGGSHDGRENDGLKNAI